MLPFRPWDFATPITSRRAAGSSSTAPRSWPTPVGQLASLASRRATAWRGGTRTARGTCNLLLGCAVQNSFRPGFYMRPAICCWVLGCVVQGSFRPGFHMRCTICCSFPLQVPGHGARDQAAGWRHGPRARVVQFHSNGGQSDSVWLSAQWGVRVVGLTKSRQIPTTRSTLPLLFCDRSACLTGTTATPGRRPSRWTACAAWPARARLGQNGVILFGWGSFLGRFLSAHHTCRVCPHGAHVCPMRRARRNRLN